MDIVSILLLLGAIHGIFLASVLLSLKGREKHANKLLAAVLFLFSIILILHVSFHSEEITPTDSTHSRLNFLFQPLLIFYSISLLIGPLLYLYAQALTKDHFTLDRNTVIHFIPAILCIGLTIPIYLIEASQESQIESIQTLTGFIHWFVFSQFLFYVFLLCFFWIKKIRPRIRERGKIRWIMTLIVSSAAIWCMALVMQVIHANHEDWNYVWLVASVFIYSCGYVAIQKPNLFHSDIRFPKKPEEKYQKSALTDQIAEDYKIKLLQYIENEKPYLNHDLTLPELAKHLKISHHYISQVINSHFNQNFFEFINQYRVEHAKKLLLDPNYNNQNLSEIGYLSGFNSTSVFNSAFKKAQDQTPRQFRENLLK